MNFLDLGAPRFVGIYAFSKTHFKMMGCDDAKFRGGLGSELGFGSGRLSGPGNGQKAVLVPGAVAPEALIPGVPFMKKKIAPPLGIEPRT